MLPISQSRTSRVLGSLLNESQMQVDETRSPPLDSSSSNDMLSSLLPLIRSTPPTVDISSYKIPVPHDTLPISHPIIKPDVHKESAPAPDPVPTPAPVLVPAPSLQPRPLFSRTALQDTGTFKFSAMPLNKTPQRQENSAPNTTLSVLPFQRRPIFPMNQGESGGIQIHRHEHQKGLQNVGQPETPVQRQVEAPRQPHQEAVQYRQETPIQHQQGIPIQHQRELPTQHQQEPTTQHQQEIPIQYQQEGTEHQPESPTQRPEDTSMEIQIKQEPGLEPVVPVRVLETYEEQRLVIVIPDDDEPDLSTEQSVHDDQNVGDTLQQQNSDPEQQQPRHNNSGPLPAANRMSAPATFNEADCLNSLAQNGSLNIYTVLANYTQKQKEDQHKLVETNRLLAAATAKLQEFEKEAIQTSEASRLEMQIQNLLKERDGYEAKITSLENDKEALSKHAENLDKKGEIDSEQLSKMNEILGNLSNNVPLKAFVEESFTRSNDLIARRFTQLKEPLTLAEIDQLLQDNLSKLRVPVTKDEAEKLIQDGFPRDFLTKFDVAKIVQDGLSKVLTLVEVEKLLQEGFSKLQSPFTKEETEKLIQDGFARLEVPLTKADAENLFAKIKDTLSKLDIERLLEEALLKLKVPLSKAEAETLIQGLGSTQKSQFEALSQSIASLKPEKNDRLSILEADNQSLKTRIEIKDEQLARLQPMEEQLTIIKEKLLFADERARNAEKKAEEANQKALEYATNTLTIQQSKILLDNLESRNDKLTKEKAALDEKILRDEQEKQTKYEAAVDFATKQLKVQYAEEVEYLKKRIESLESEISSTRLEVEKVNEFRKKATDQLSNCMERHSNEMMKWENEKSQLLTKIRTSSTSRPGYKPHDVNNPFKPPSALVRSTFFHKTPTPDSVDDSPLLSKSRAAMNNAQSSSEQSISDPVTPVQGKLVEVSVVTEQIASSEGEASAIPGFESLEQALQYESAKKLAHVDEENSSQAQEAILKGNDTHSDDDSSLQKVGHVTLQEIPKDPKRSIDWVNVDSSPFLPPKRSKTVSQSALNEDERSNKPVKVSEPNSLNEIERPNTQDTTRRRATRSASSQRGGSNLSPIAEIKGQAGDDRVRPKSSHSHTTKSRLRTQTKGHRRRSSQ